MCATLFSSRIKIPASMDKAGVINEMDPDVRREILARSQSLKHTDRELIASVFDQGEALPIVAARYSMSYQALVGHLSGLLKRMASPQFVWVLDNLHLLTDERRALAAAHYLRGIPRAEVCLALRMTLHTFRQHCTAINAICLHDLRKGAA